uniref:PIH1 N-terminal domain-containing protein n=1 Tax=Lotharella globosa TaxID=91324 RepID=A0A7S3Z0Q4_9EUKA
MAAKSDANYEYMWAEYKKVLDRNKEIEENSIEIYPEPSFVARIPCELEGVDEDISVVLNLCQSIHVDAPCETPDHTGQMRVRLPLSCGPLREEKDGAGNQCVAFDVVFHPEVITRCQKETAFKETVASFAFQNIQRKFKVTPAGKFQFPRIRYMGIRPAKQRIRKKTASKKVEEIGKTKTPLPSSDDDKLPPSMFQAKIPKVKAEPPPMTKQEAKMLEDFRKHVPGLKHEEMRKALLMYQKTHEEEKKRAEMEKEIMEEKKKIPLFSAPKYSIFCFTHSGAKLSLNNFLGRVYVKAASENQDVPKRPVSLVVYVNLKQDPESKDDVSRQIVQLDINDGLITNSDRNIDVKGQALGFRKSWSGRRRKYSRPQQVQIKPCMAFSYRSIGSRRQDIEIETEN